ncbi:MAG: hypothetical protein AB7O80_20930 [Acetobacteraceae bacterium]
MLIFDTSILCCLLRVPGKDTAGPGHDHWDFERINHLIEKEIAAGSTFVLPLASIIETGNHISQTRGDRFSLAVSLADLIRKTAEANTPWAAFSDQADLWSKDQLNRLGEAWPKLAAAGLSIGDATIRDVAEYYARGGYHVEIVTGDAGLKAYEPAAPPPVPRRRR